MCLFDGLINKLAMTTLELSLKICQQKFPKLKLKEKNNDKNRIEYPRTGAITNSVTYT